MKSRFHDDMTMEAIMREWPDAISVLIKRGLLCVGCPIASFHTVSDAAREHELDEDLLLRELTAVMK